MIGSAVTEWVLSVVITVSLVTLGVISTIELSLDGVKFFSPNVGLALVAIMTFMIFWALRSFLIVPPLDVPFTAGSLREILGGFAVGCLGGLFVALTSFAAMQTTSHSPGISMPRYIKCQSNTWLERASAVLP